MTMSWVAETVATITAPNTISGSDLSGSFSPRKTIAAISSSCVNTSQPRRRPNQRDSSGTSSASISGAQKNLKV